MTQEDLDFDMAYKQWFPLIQRKTSLWRRYMRKEEAEQIACLALWKSMRHYQEGRAKFITYFINYMNWEFLNTQSARKKHIKTSSVDSLALGEWEALSVVDDEQIFLGEQIEILKKYLDPKHIEVLNYMIEGKMSKEIAKRKKVSKQRVHQMREHIRGVACDLRRRGQIHI